MLVANAMESGMIPVSMPFLKRSSFTASLLSIKIEKICQTGSAFFLILDTEYCLYF
jgi:hypothetical protein